MCCRGVRLCPSCWLSCVVVGDTHKHTTHLVKKEKMMDQKRGQRPHRRRLISLCSDSDEEYDPRYPSSANPVPFSSQMGRIKGGYDPTPGFVFLPKPNSHHHLDRHSHHHITSFTLTPTQIRRDPHLD